MTLAADTNVDQPGKLELSGPRIDVAIQDAIDLTTRLFVTVGCSRTDAGFIAHHLADAELSGVESHGMMRVLQYIEQFQTGVMSPTARPLVMQNAQDADIIDGCGSSGIVAMRLAMETAISRTGDKGIAALAVINCGHTGRLGAFAERAADAGCLAVITGGGARDRWPMVAPYGGQKGVLPTNPWCVGMPGGEHGPVVMDCSTAMLAGGWIYAAQKSGALLPDGAITDANGNPTRDPQDYFNGGAILPKGGVLGYGMAIISELLCEAMLGPVTGESNTLILVLDTKRYRGAKALQDTAEEILMDLRRSPPAPGFERVDIPGERERRIKAEATTMRLPESTWQQILDLAAGMACDRV